MELADLLNKNQGQITTFSDAIDMCGTGGDKSNTFNISTLASIVVSSYGAKVIKHSGRSTTSITGSVDILNEFGTDLDTSEDIKEICFKKFGLMFVSSQLLRETFGKAKQICKKLNTPGFVNLIGPLTNPYKTNFHLLGVSSIEWGKLIVNTLQLLGKNEALVVCSNANNICLDELSFCGKNYIWRLSNEKITEETFNPSDLGKKIINLNNLIVKDINESKLVFENLLKGALKNDPKEDIVALNAGAALYLTKKVKSIRDGYDFALRHIQSGKAWEHFQDFMNCNKKGLGEV